MPVKGTYLALAGGGIILAWSGLKGKKWSSVLRNIVSGGSPQSAQSGSQITGASYGYGYGVSNTSGVSTPSNTSETAWIRSLLKSLGAPQNNANISSMSAWISRETPWPPVAKNNPLNTTLPAPGATNYNSKGVKNYPSSAEGMTATVTTLLAYPEIVHRLRSGEGLCGWTSPEFLTWSGNGYDSVC